MSSQASTPSSPSSITEEISTRTMSDVVNGEDIINIKQFTPVFEEINDDDKAFEHYWLCSESGATRECISNK
ncbi:unnamed protein product [Rhizophagus irregularis]|uniref:Uncharacterized protein n=1 Tax=Rhizophagus irregularis TaxID=588596 RepID=A0A915YRI6_9GLOM|nr:unnamed protein product [Rhizophagus irregularis]CAB5199907.1 unnamed protein product [Rhizophagus irregularis]CAB5322076.1 unnamed protein product [Rhizophagus irregularis]